MAKEKHVKPILQEIESILKSSDNSDESLEKDVAALTKPLARLIQVPWFSFSPSRSLITAPFPYHSCKRKASRRFPRRTCRAVCRR
mgnify:CR=1 FL=1